MTDEEIREDLRNHTITEIAVGTTPKGEFLLDRYDELIAAGVSKEKALAEAEHDADVKFGTGKRGA